ncbi:MAG: hypothetical protein WB609_05775 [Candidatus Cybelea sp.]
MQGEDGGNCSTMNDRCNSEFIASVRIRAASHSCGSVTYAWIWNVDLLVTPALTLVAVAGCQDGVAAATIAGGRTSSAIAADEYGAY